MVIRVEDALLVLILLNILDVITTRRALALGGREANPLARWLLNRYGTVGLWFAKMLMFGVVGFLGLAGWISEGTLWFYNIVYGLIVAWNSFINWRLTK